MLEESIRFRLYQHLLLMVKVEFFHWPKCLRSCHGNEEWGLNQNAVCACDMDVTFAQQHYDLSFSLSGFRRLLLSPSPTDWCLWQSSTSVINLPEELASYPHVQAHFSSSFFDSRFDILCLLHTYYMPMSKIGLHLNSSKFHIFQTVPLSLQNSWLFLELSKLDWRMSLKL